MSLPLVVPRGVQEPRLSKVPDAWSSAGDELVDFCESFGLILDPWQQLVLQRALRERSDGSWAAFEVGVILPRQNGKGSLLEARGLGGIFHLNEPLVIHTAHEFKTAAEGFVRVKSYVDNYDHLRKRVRIMRTGAGTESIELLNGNRLRFVARSAGSGRGFSGDCVLLDEAYALTDTHMAALLPTLSARPNPQVWYTSSAGMPDSTVLRRLRTRAREDRSPRLAYFEWSAPETASSDDREAWALANPALGIRITDEFVAQEREALGETEFRRERLGIWPEDGVDYVIPPEAWLRLVDPDSRISDPVAFAVDMPWDRSMCVVSAASKRPDGRLHVEIAEQFAEPNHAKTWLVERAKRWRPCVVAVDPNGPAGSLIAELEPALEDAGVKLWKVSGPQMAQACGAFYDMTKEDKLRHLNDPRLTASLNGARKSDRGDVWRWDRKDSKANIAPLVAATLAVHGAVVYGNEGTPNIW